VRQSHPLLEEVDAPTLAAALAGDRFVDRAPAEIPKDRDVVVYCHVGARSAQAAVWLKASGWARARSLAGGIDAWSEQVDPRVPRYR
jgi:rhodanese-related sulfurtransferase